MVVLMLLLLIYPVAQYYSTKHPDEHIQILPYPNTKEYLGLALNKDNKALQEEINKAIADMKAMVNLIHYIKNGLM